MEQVAGKKVFAVRMTPKKGDAATFYFAAETGTFKFEYDDLAVEKLICIDMDNNSVPVSVAIESPLSREIAAFRDLVNSNILSSTDLDLGIVITKVLEGTELSLKRREAKIPFKSCLSN